MTQSDLFVKSLLFYFLPKLAIYLPLAWLAICLWWADDSSSNEPGSIDDQPSDGTGDSDDQEGSWYQSLLGSSQEQGRPGGDWL